VLHPASGDPRAANSVRHVKLALHTRQRDQALASISHAPGDLASEKQVLEILY
jgi:hypothetical protein